MRAVFLHEKFRHFPSRVDTHLCAKNRIQTDSAGMGDYANPQSILRAEVMLLRHIGRAAAADRLEAALDACPAVITGRPDGATCADYGDGVLKLI